MPADASAVLGHQQLAAARVNRRGFFWHRMSIQGGLAGILIARLMLGKDPGKDTRQTPPFGTIALLAVTEYELALVKLASKAGFAVKPSDVIARVPLNEISSVNVRRGMAMQIDITFRTGDTWCLEVVPGMKKGAKAVVAVLRQRTGAAALAS